MNKIDNFKEQHPEYAAVPNDILAGKLYDKHYKDVMPRNEFDYRMGVKDLDYNFVDNAAASYMMSLDDEVEALGRASGAAVGNLLTGKKANFSGEYDNFLEDYRLRQKIYREENPIKSISSGLMGGAAFGGPAFVGLAPKAGPIVSGTVTGGAMGGIEGFSAGEGGLENRAKSSAIGTVFGSVLGGLIPAAIIGGGKAINTIKQTFGLLDVPNASIQRVVKAMDDDGLTPDQMASMFEDMSKKGGAIVDQGDNLQSLGAYVSKQPGKGRQIAQEFVNNRQAGQVDRISADIKKYVSNDDLYQSVDDLIAKRSVDAQPLYKKAYEKDFVWSDTLEGLLERKPVQKALKNAVDIIETKGGNAKALGFNFNEAGDVIFDETPSMEALDYIKRGMDDVIERYRDKTTGRLVLDTKGRAFNDLLNDYKKELVKLNPDYGKALNAYSGPSKSIDIITRGRSFQRQHPKEIQKYLKNLSPEDVDLYRIGVAQQMLDTVNKAAHGADKSRYLVGSKQKQEALSAIFGGEKNLANLLKALELESKMHQTYSKVTGGSPTQILQAEGQAMKGLDVAQNAARGDWLGAVGSVLRSISEKSRGVNSRTTEEIAKLLFQDNPAELSRISKSFSNHALNAQLSNRARMATLGLITPSSAVQANQVLREKTN